MTIREVEIEARRLASQDRSTSYPAEYTRLLEMHPEAYEGYRAQHNAKAITAALRNAGYELRPITR